MNSSSKHLARACALVGAFALTACPATDPATSTTETTAATDDSTSTPETSGSTTDAASTSETSEPTTGTTSTTTEDSTTDGTTAAPNPELEMMFCIPYCEKILECEIIPLSMEDCVESCLDTEVVPTDECMAAKLVTLGCIEALTCPELFEDGACAEEYTAEFEVCPMPRRHSGSR